jgi:acetyl esterase/lipase
MWTCARWLLRAGPADYMLAMSVAPASLPVIGKHLEPLGAATAMGVWGYRHMPDFVGASARSWFNPGSAELRRQDRDATNAVAQAALRGIVAVKDLAIEWPAPESAPPLCKFRQHRRSVYRTSVRYGNLPSQLLDVWRAKELPVERAPVLIFVPGGAWVHGSRVLQGYALMSHLAEMGWVCLSIDYRVAPHHRWPAHITDVKTAIAWARANVDKFGGDRNFIAIAGCSAGGHLSALAGLTPNDPEMQADLPVGSDTSVDAVAAVLRDPRQRRQRHTGRTGAKIRRALACRVACSGQLRRASRRGPRVRHDRRRPHRVDDYCNRLVPQPDSPKPDAHAGQRGYIGSSR